MPEPLDPGARLLQRHRDVAIAIGAGEGHHACAHGLPSSLVFVPMRVIRPNRKGSDPGRPLTAGPASVLPAGALVPIRDIGVINAILIFMLQHRHSGPCDPGSPRPAWVPGGRADSQDHMDQNVIVFETG
jgi:hypothetical protein